MRVNGLGLVKEVEFWLWIGKVKRGLVEASDCSDVFPIAVKDVRVDFLVLYGHRNDFLSKVGLVVVQDFFHRRGVENVNAHAGKILFFGRQVGVSGGGGNLPVVDVKVRLWFFHEFRYAVFVVDFHYAKAGGVAAVYGCRGDCDVRAACHVRVEKCLQVHVVKLVARQNDVVAGVLRLKVDEVFANRVRRSFVPARMFQRLLRRQNFYESL